MLEILPLLIYRTLSTAGAVSEIRGFPGNDISTALWGTHSSPSSSALPYPEAIAGDIFCVSEQISVDRSSEKW